MKDKKVNGIHCKRNTSFTLTYIFSTSPFHVMCNTELFSVKKYSTYYYWCQSMSNNDLDQEYELYDEKLIVRLQDKQLYSLVMSFICILLTTKNRQSTDMIITLFQNVISLYYLLMPPTYQLTFFSFFPLAFSRLTQLTVNSLFSCEDCNLQFNCKMYNGNGTVLCGICWGSIIIIGKKLLQ